MDHMEMMKKLFHNFGMEVLMCKVTGPSGTVQFPLPHRMNNGPSFNLARIHSFINQRYPGGFRLFWTDDEGDLIRIVTEEDFEEAVRVSRETSSDLDLHIQIGEEEKNEVEPKQEVKPGADVKAEAKKEIKEIKEAKMECPVKRCPAVRLYPANRGLVRHAAICDVCSKTIFGIRYKCTQCADYDLCSSCEEKNAAGELHDALHVFAKLRKHVPVLREPLIPESPYLAAGRRTNSCHVGRVPKIGPCVPRLNKKCRRTLSIPGADERLQTLEATVKRLQSMVEALEREAEVIPEVPVEANEVPVETKEVPVETKEVPVEAEELEVASEEEFAVEEVDALYVPEGSLKDEEGEEKEELQEEVQEDESLRLLKSMGFEEGMARAALVVAKGDIQRALGHLL